MEAVAARREMPHDPRRVGIDATAVVMRKFLTKHAALTTETLSCLDRLLFKGHLPLGYPHAKEDFLSRRGILIKDLKGFVLKVHEPGIETR